MEQNVKDYVDQLVQQKEHVAIALALQTESELTYYCKGNASCSSTENVTKNHLFEIGSISKVFTALLMVIAEDEEKLSLCEPMGKLLDRVFDVQAPLLEKLTFLDIMRHLSSLPRLPANMDPKDLDDPYSDYSRDAFKAALDLVEWSTDYQYNYSNFGYALLGFILEDLYQTSYEALLKEKIFSPLQMSSSLIHTLNNKYAISGHSDTGEMVPDWNFGLFEAAGGIRSTLSDMTYFVKACLFPETTSIGHCIQKTFQTIQPKETSFLMGYGWHCIENGQKIFFHDGNTGGYCSFIGLIPEEKRGIIILANSDSSHGEMGLEILKPGLFETESDTTFG